MLKIFQSFLFTVLLVFLSTSIVSAQGFNASKDVYTGRYVKTDVPRGQNIPTPYSPDLVQLYDNGPLITHPGGGAGGNNASALQTALSMTLYGFGAQITAGNSMADDFTISGADWEINELHFFTYQTGSTTTSTITDLRFQIYNGAPNAGGTVIWGDLTTNRLSSTSWTNIYRVLDTDLLNTQRPIMRAVAQLSTPITLSAGTYWIEFQFGGTLTSGPWAPPVTILGQTTTGNALQKTSAGWAAALDGSFPQGVPFLIFGNSGPPCPVGLPSNPNPPDGATGVPISGNTATWTNGAGTTQVELWFGPQGNLTQVYTGPAISSFALPTLSYVTTYGWYVVCKNDTCGVTGPTWTFTTMQDPNLNCVFLDNFEGGLTAWTIENLGGTTGCVWTQYFPPYPNLYTMPATSSGGVLAADVDECGSGSTLNSTAQIGPFNASLFQQGYVKFDQDFNAIDADDACYVEVSNDGGTTWNIIWSRIGVDLRATTEQADMSLYSNQQPAVLVRFRSVQPGWDWWWTIDNVEVCLFDAIPVELTSFIATADYGSVELNWITSTETNNRGFEVQRSAGGEFETIAFVEGHGTTTEVQAYNYIDRNVNVGSYSYRLKQVDFDGTFKYSDVVEVDVPMLREFALDQNYPNPFNPSTKISFRLAVDSKVSLKVFDVLGQEVATLVNTNMSVGGHSVDFDASLLNSGVYLYRLEAVGIDGTNFIDVKKMILTK
jgi:hypothetical protein